MGLRLPAAAPELLGDGVLLAPWEEGDLPGIVELADEAGRWWSGSLHAVRSVDDARRWLAGRSGPGRIDWAVRDSRTRSLVGRTGLRRFGEHPPAAEIGYGVHPAHRGRGVATAAVATAVRYAFGALALRRLELVHDSGNVASCAVAARSGFALEGVERSAMGYPDGREADQHRHARLSTDPLGPADAAPVALDVPVIKADGLLLRPWRDGDSAVYLRGLTDPTAARWSPRPAPVTEDDAARLITRLHRRAREGATLAWAVEVDGSVGGSVALRNVNLVDRHATASYWVLPEVRGRGIAPKALGMATGHAFETLGLHRVQLQHALANTASCRVAEKARFRLESIQRESCLLAEGFVDEHEHARLATD